MKNRIIRASFWLNEELADCDPHTRLLFIGLWGFADREGLFEWRLKQIKASIFPYENVKIELLLNKLLDKKFIIKYEVDGNFYGLIVNFKKHQSIHKHEASSKLPGPDVDTCRYITGSVSTDIPSVCSNSNSNSSSSSSKTESITEEIADDDPIITLKIDKDEYSTNVKMKRSEGEKLREYFAECLDGDRNLARIKLWHYTTALEKWIVENPKKKPKSCYLTLRAWFNKDLTKTKGI